HRRCCAPCGDRGLTRAVPRGSADVRLLCIDRGGGADLDDRPLGGWSEAGMGRGLARLCMWGAGRAGPPPRRHREDWRPMDRWFTARQRGAFRRRSRPGSSSPRRSAGMIRINLAPPAAGRPAAPSTLRLGLIFGVLIALLVGGLGGFGVKLGVDISDLQREIAGSEADLARLRARIAEGQRVRSEMEELRRDIDAIETAARSQVRPAYLLSTLANALPPDVWLIRVEEKGRHMRLAGSSRSSVGLSAFMTSLDRSGRFRDIELVESRLDPARGSGVISFEL